MSDIKEIVVVSGKGGVGKTSVSAALSRLLAPLSIADADVDAADLNLVLKHDISHKERVLGAKLAVVDSSRCTGCTTCETTCRFGAISCTPKAVVDESGCEGCGACALTCTADAITMEKREHGSLIEAESLHGPFSYARLDPGAENSGKLVSLVRERAQAAAKAANHRYLLIDGPPGCGCPTTAAITGCDLVVAICEPSSSSHHDLMRLLDLAGHFSRPAIAVINKADINESLCRKIHEDLAARDIPVVAELPYDPAVTEAQFHMRDVIDFASASMLIGLQRLADAVRDAVRPIPQQPQPQPQHHGIP